ncbi:hypothetical protein [Rhizobacter sp. P5_C2]
MFNDLLSSTPATADRQLPDGRLAPRAKAPGSASIDECEWRQVFAQGEYQRAFVELSAAYYEDYGRPLDEDSWAGLIRFLIRTPMRVLPTMGAEASGRIIATWQIGNEALSLEFLDRFQLKFAVTASVDGALERRWGRGHAVALFDVEPLTARFAG